MEQCSNGDLLAKMDLFSIIKQKQIQLLIAFMGVTMTMRAKFCMYSHRAQRWRTSYPPETMPFSKKSQYSCQAHIIEKRNSAAAKREKTKES